MNIKELLSLPQSTVLITVCSTSYTAFINHSTTQPVSSITTPPSLLKISKFKTVCKDNTVATSHNKNSKNQNQKGDIT